MLFQTTISKLRDVLAATGRGREDRSVGILAAVNAATENRRGKLLTSGAQLNRLLDQLNSVVSTDQGPSTVSALIDATHGLAATAPDLVDALHQAVEPMQVLAEKRSALTTLLTGGQHTVGTTHTAIDNHIDQLTGITNHLTPVLGSLAMNAGKFVPAFTKLNGLSRKFFDEVWIPELDTGNMRVNLSLTPSYSYTRADCPRYGQLLGPSCYTAPEIVVRPDLPEMLLPQNYQPPKDLAPTPGTVVGSEWQPRRGRAAADQSQPEPGRPESARAVVGSPPRPACRAPPIPPTHHRRRHPQQPRRRCLPKRREAPDEVSRPTDRAVAVHGRGDDADLAGVRHAAP